MGCKNFYVRGRELLKATWGDTETQYLKIMVADAETCWRGMEFGAHRLYGASFIGGVQGLKGMFKKASYYKLDKLEDYGNIVKRLKQASDNCVKLMILCYYGDLISDSEIFVQRYGQP